MKKNFRMKLSVLKNNIIEAINEEVKLNGGEIELSKDKDLICLDMYPFSLDYCSRFEILRISDEHLDCRDVEADSYHSFYMNEIDIENLLFIYEVL